MLLTGPKSEEDLRLIILQPKKYIQEETRKEAELKSSLYQVIYTNVLCPIGSSFVKKGLRKASSGRAGEAEEEDGDDKKKEQIGRQTPDKELLAALEINHCDFPIIIDLLHEILNQYAVRLDIEYSNSDDSHLGEFVDMLLNIISTEEVSSSDVVCYWRWRWRWRWRTVERFFELFFRKIQVGQVSEEPAENVDCRNFHIKFKCVQPWNKDLMKRDNHDKGLVPNTPFCLWTALHLAMIDAGIPAMSGEIDRQKIKEQCLGFMLNDDRAKQTTEKFKKEFANMRFIIRNQSGIVVLGVSEYYEVLF